MELIIAIFFFSLAAAVCVRLFVGAHKLAEKSVNLNSAIEWSQNLAETFYSSKGDINSITKIFSSSYATENEIILFFDDNWNVMAGTSTHASYEIIMILQHKSASEVYSDVTKYQNFLSGEAIIGEISVIDVRNSDDVLLNIPKDSDMIILSNTVDVYLESEAQNE